jgi:hypothetical protein
MPAAVRERRPLDDKLGPAHLLLFCSTVEASMDRDQVLRLLLPLWGVAFVAGFIIACR